MIGGGRETIGVVLPMLFALALCAGCRSAARPKSFRASDLTNPAPLIRARAVTMGDRLPEREVVPVLIDHLDDPDPVVRLTAHEELRRRTGQDFGYHPWDDRAERGQAISRWRAWWSNHAARSVRPTPQGRVRQA